MHYDPRLTQEVTIHEPGARLGEVLARVSAAAGVPLDAAFPLVETVIVCRYEGPLSGFMEALAQFAAVDKDHPARWRKGHTGAYILERSPRALEALQALKRERQEEVVQALEASLTTGKPEALPLKVLDREHRGVVYAGGEVGVVPGAPHWTKLRQALMGEAGAGWSARTGMAVSLVGGSRQTRRLAWRWIDEARGQELEESAWLYHLAPELGHGPQRQRWERRLGVDRGKDPLTTLRVDRFPEGPISRADWLGAVADEIEVNLIAEDHGQTLSRPSSIAGLFPWLDAMCEPGPGPIDAPGAGMAYFWRKVGEVYLIRSLDWPEEETRPMLRR